MQAEFLILPELDRSRNDPETGPVRRARNVADGVTRRVFGNRLFQRESAFERAGLFGSPCADAAAAGARCEISVGLGIGYQFDRTAHAHLAAQRFPMEAHGRFFLS